MEREYRMKKTLIKICFLLIFFLILASCSQDAQIGTSLSLIETVNPDPLSTEENDDSEEIAQDIKETVLAEKQIYDCIVIKGKKDVLVAYKVRHMKRFRMKNIESKLKKKLENKFPDENFTVSSDYKIFLEAYRLKKLVDNEESSLKDAEKRLKEIVKLSKEKT